MELLGVQSHVRTVGTSCRSVWMNTVYARSFTLRNPLVVVFITLLLRNRFLAGNRLYPAAIQLFSYFLGCFILSNLSLLNPTLLVEHVEEGSVQLIFGVQEEDRGVVEVQNMILLNQFLDIRFRICCLESLVLLLAIIHIPNHALDFGRAVKHFREVRERVSHLVPFSILGCK